LTITIAGLAHIVSAMVILIYSLAYQNPITLSISVALILLFYYEYRTFADIRRCIEKVRVRRFLDRKFVEELGEVEQRIVIENNCGSPLPKVTLIDILPKFLSSKPSKPIFNIVIPPKKGIEISYKIQPLVPGVHDIQSLVMVFYDTLGYFSEKVTVDYRESLVVLPLSARLSISLQSLQRLIGLAIKGKSIGGAYDLANIRDYTPSDDARKILWKAYARTGKLVVREDYGESIAKILVLIDLRKYMWDIGSPPNTLAQIQLRYARSLIEYLVKNRCVVDIALCSGLVPKVVRNAERDVMGAIYNLMSVLPAGEGCSSPISVFIDSVKHLDRTYEFYDAVILITNPITIAIDYTLEDLESLLEVFISKLVIAIPRFNYESLMSEQNLRLLLKIISSIVESSGLGTEISNDDLKIITPRGGSR